MSDTQQALDQGRRLAGKTALITGAGSGLGREVAHLFARQGAHVIASDLIERRAKMVGEELAAAGYEALAVVADVRKESDVAAAVAQAVERFGRLDVMHANAGVGVPGQGGVAFEDTTAESWDTVNDVNLKGVFYSIKHAARAMKLTGGGSIVVTSSAASLVAYPGMAVYAAGKGGVNALVRGAAFDLGKYGIRVNAVLPTFGMSINFALAPEAEVLGKSYEQVSGPWYPEHAPMPLKITDPPSLLDNAYPVLFLASDEARYLTGVCLSTTDGGVMSRTAIPFPEGWTLEERIEAMELPPGTLRARPQS
jgi:NAD(P)-dependent dehydrogenase (short-subunit alcohol dehydrogenase family)